jgi:hypothetical protein
MRLVVKIGALCSRPQGHIDTALMRALVDQSVSLQQN